MPLLRSVFAFLVRLIAGARASVDPSYRPGRRASVLHLPPRAIYFANHSSHLDFVTIWSVLPGSVRQHVRPVAAKDYWGEGWKARFLRHMFHPVLVARGREVLQEMRAERDTPDDAASLTLSARGRGLRGQLAELGTVLDEGDSLILFPEGTRGGGTRLGTFHAGLARLARAYPEVPVIPVALSNLGRMLPKGGLVPVPLLGTIDFLAPLRAEPGERDSEYLARTRSVLIEAMSDASTEDEPQETEASSTANPTPGEPQS